MMTLGANRTQITRWKFIWLDMVATDPNMRGLPTSFAVTLMHRYFSAKSLTAWPGMDRLANDLRTTRRNIQKAVRKLQAGGYLEVTFGGGKERPNVYKPTRPKDIELIDEWPSYARTNRVAPDAVTHRDARRQTASQRSQTASQRVAKQRHPRRPNQLNEPIEDNHSADAARSDDRVMLARFERRLKADKLSVDEKDELKDLCIQIVNEPAEFDDPTWNRANRLLGEIEVIE